MAIINEFFDINCTVKNWAQGLDPVLHQYACGVNANEYGAADLAEGSMLKARRGIEASLLNSLLGTDYTENLLVQPDCAEAGGGICVYTRNEGDSYITVDAFRPKDGYYVKTTHMRFFDGQDIPGADEVFYNENAEFAELGIRIMRFPVIKWIADASVILANGVESYMGMGNPRYPTEFQTGIESPPDLPADAPVVAETHRRRTYREAIARWETDDEILR